MTIWKKALSVATSAALLASLLTAVAAPAAFAANTSAGGGIIYPDYAASAPFSITFQEDAVDQYSNGSFTVAVYDSAGVDANATFSTTVAPTVTRNLGVGTASAGFVGDTLVVNISGTDNTKIESWTIGGLKASAGAAAAKGALIFDVTLDTVNLSQVLTTATGTTTSAITGGVSTTVTYAVDAGSPLFQVTGTACVGGAASAGNVTVAASGVVAAETFSTSTAAGTFTKATPFTGDKPVGTAVSQSACAARFPSPVIVGDAVLASNYQGLETLQAGVNEQDAGGVQAQLGFFDGLLLNGDTVTFTIETAGVAFSPNSCVLGCLSATGITIGTPTLGAERKSVTVAITADATADDYLQFNPDYDVALNVPNGTTVDVAVTVSRAGVVVLDSPVTVAVVGYVAVGSTAAPTIYIGQNDQSTGMITITESAAGVLTDDGLLEVCLQTDESWAVGRYFWAVVTSGDLKLNAAGLPVTQAKMTIDGDCLTVLPYTASTVASTIEIRDGTSSAPVVSGPTNGPKVNVPNYMSPGQTYVRVYNDEAQVADNIVIAVRAYTGTPTATVSAQLPVVRGLLAQPVGSITITEGAPNQFQGGEFELCITYTTFAEQVATRWTTPVGVNQPVVTSNSTVSGLIVTYDNSDPSHRCLYFDVTDTGLSGLGTITISNLKMDVNSDAPLGSVFVSLKGSGGQMEQSLSIQQIVSPATVVAKRTLSIGAVSALGLNPTSGYSTKTPKVQTPNKYVTWKFTGGAALAGQRVNVLVAQRINGAWGGPKYLASRWADANGIVTFSWKAPAGTVLNVRVQWPGNAMYNVSTSKALGVHWK